MPSSSKVYNFTTYPDHSHQCVAMKPDQAKMLPSPLELLQGSNLKRTAIGTEVVEGHPTKVENVIVTRPDGKTVESKVWEAEDLQGIPVRIESHIGEITLIADLSRHLHCCSRRGALRGSRQVHGVRKNGPGRRANNA